MILPDPLARILCTPPLRGVVLRLLAALLMAGLTACVRGDGVAEWEGNGGGEAGANVDTAAFVDVPGPAVREAVDSSFARLVARLSEPGGYFDSDNLVSNELSYQHVIGAMQRLRVTGGAYIGVGPDQNYTYIALVRPKIAYMLDIRRDNLLQHLLYKALFDLSRNRVEYLAQLLGKPAPVESTGWERRTLTQLVTYLDSVPSRRELFDSARVRVARRVAGYGIPLAPHEFETIARIHERFFLSGLNLQYESLNRPSRRNYPTYRALLEETDLTGKQRNYFAREDDFQFLKSLHGRDLIVPVTGNLAGNHALRAVAADIAARGEQVSVLYVSNVEFYLFREGTFDTFAENVRALPRGERSVIVRSYFNGPYTYQHAQWVPGYFSTQILQSLPSFVAEYGRGGYASYMDLVTKHSIPLR
jgi:hypothetical protein